MKNSKSKPIAISSVRTQLRQFSGELLLNLVDTVERAAREDARTCQEETHLISPVMVYTVLAVFASLITMRLFCFFQSIGRRDNSFHGGSAMRTVAVVNQKGGSGKTTTSVNLAAALGKGRKKVLVIDLDAQMSATAWYGIEPVDKGVFAVFADNGNLTDIVVNTGITGVDIIPASSWLVGVERALANEVGTETILRRKIEELESSRWDFILIDCPPALGILTVNALVAADEVLVPVEAHVMALAGLAQLMETVDVVRARLNSDLEISGIVACRVDARTRHAQDVVTQLREHFGELVFDTVIRENVRLAECPSFAQPITEYAPSSTGAKDYLALAREFRKRGK